MNNGLEFADALAILSLYLGVRNLSENESQSDAQLKIIRQIDVGAQTTGRPHICWMS